MIGTIAARAALALNAAVALFIADLPLLIQSTAAILIAWIIYKIRH